MAEKRIWQEAVPASVRIELARQARAFRPGSPVFAETPAGCTAAPMLSGDALACLEHPELAEGVLGVLCGHPLDAQGCLAFRTVRNGRRLLAVWTPRSTQAQEFLFDDAARRPGLQAFSGGRGLRLLSPEDDAAAWLAACCARWFRCVLDVPGQTLWLAERESAWRQPVFGAADGTPWAPLFNRACTAVYACIRAARHSRQERTPDAGSAVLKESEEMAAEWTARTSALLRSGGLALRGGPARQRAMAARVLAVFAERLLGAVSGTVPLPEGDSVRSLLAELMKAEGLSASEGGQTPAHGSAEEEAAA